MSSLFAWRYSFSQLSIRTLEYLLYTTYCLRASFPILECTFTVFQHPLLFLNDLSCFRTSFSCFQTFFLVIEQVAYFVVNRYVTTYINLIQLLTWGATNQDMSLFMKSRLGGCYKTRHVTKRDVLVLATLRYMLILWWVLNI